MENITVTETRIGATVYTVERVFSKEAKEDAIHAIKRLLLQKARSVGRELLYDSSQISLDIWRNQR